MMGVDENQAFKVFLLGQPHMRVGGDAWKFSAPPKALALFARLLLHAGKPFTREGLAFALWPDSAEGEARANLRRHFHLVLKALPPQRHDRPWLLTDAASARWNPAAAVWVDALEFVQLAATPETRAQAIELYGGDFLEPLYEDWVITDRERLTQLYSDTLLQLVRQMRSDRNFSEAARYASLLLGVDPWREDATRHLMSALYDSGDRSGALRAFDDFAARLRREMDVEPMPETIALRELIVRQAALPPEPDRQSERVDIMQRERGRPGMPFVGRRSEIDHLRGCWNRAARGHGGFVLVGGEAGVGKSRLADELALIAESQGGRIVRGSTSALEGAPYQCFIEALRGAAALLTASDLDPLWIAAVAELLPELYVERKDLRPPPSADENGRRARLFEALVQCFAAVAMPRPAVIVLEDLHWAGEATIAAATFLGRRIARLPVLVVATYREEEVARDHPLRRMRRVLQRERMLTQVSLGPLTSQDVDDLFTSLPALHAFESEIARAVHARSEGNALFVGELILELIESGAPGGATPTLEPSSIRSTILSRVDRLSARARTVLDVAAVAGPTFTMEIPRDVLGWAEADLQRELDDLIDRHIVRDAGGFDYAFAHHLIQSTVYDAIDARERRRRHRRIGELLEGYGRENVAEHSAELARHFEEGADPSKAVHYYALAAQRALDLSAHAEASSLATRGLKLEPQGDQRFALLRTREAASARTGDLQQRKADLAALEAMAAENGDHEATLYVLGRKTDLARSVGDYAGAWQSIRALREEAASAGDEGALSTAAQAASKLHLFAGELKEARQEIDAARNYAEQSGDRSGVIDCWCADAQLSVTQRDFGAARRALATARSLAESSGNPARLAAVLYQSANAENFAGRPSDGLALAREAIAVFRRIGDRVGEAETLAIMGAMHLRQKEYADGRRLLEEAIMMSEQHGKVGTSSNARGNLALLESEAGLVDRAIAIAVRARDDLEDVQDYLGVAVATVNLSDFYMTNGDFRAARDLARNALEQPALTRFELNRVLLLGNLAVAQRELGEIAEAIKNITEAYQVASTVEDRTTQCFMTIEAAATYLRDGDSKKARELADEYLERFDGVDMFGPVQHQYGYWVAAQAYRACGDALRARELLDKARATLDAMTELRPAGEVRDAFLQLRYNRAILEAAGTEDWASAVPALSSARRPRRTSKPA